MCGWICWFDEYNKEGHLRFERVILYQLHIFMAVFKEGGGGGGGGPRLSFSLSLVYKYLSIA